VKSHAFRSSLAGILALLAAAPAMAEVFDFNIPIQLDIAAFVKNEYSLCNNCSQGLANPSSFDPRGVLNPPDPMLNQGGEAGGTSENLFLAMLTANVFHEFDNAIKIEARATARIRNSGPDIFDNYWIDLYGGVSYPKYGLLQVGKMTSRSWTRSDSFAYPLGLSSPWAESGAGYGLFPEAVRYGTPQFEIPLGKIYFEATYATADTRPPLNADLVAEGCPTCASPPTPKLYEVFLQYSNEKNLIELIYQGSEGGRQSSFSKGAFFGAQGDTNGPTGSPGYRKPYETVVILQGNYWLNPAWKFSYGLKWNEWSGQQQQCDFGPVSPVASGCFWDQPGFNYAKDGKLHHAEEWDAMLGVAYTRQLWVYTLGGVRMNKAYTNTPTEWGQSNTATFLKLGVYRKVPEIYSKMEVYAGLGHVVFGRQGPAPLSMPSNTAFGGVDPRTSESGDGLTLGVNFLY
jgi:hypothetical protein